MHCYSHYGERKSEGVPSVLAKVWRVAEVSADSFVHTQ